jgi:hypothetical protein
MFRAAAQIDQKQDQAGRDQQNRKDAADFAHALLANFRFSRLSLRLRRGFFPCTRALLSGAAFANWGRGFLFFRR